MVLDGKDLTFGFVGTGTITEAVITGMCKTDFRSNAIVVSPRSEGIAARLAAEHDNVSVAGSNQEVVDRADVVFLAVRLQIVEEVVRALKFRQGQRVVSFVAATSIEQLVQWIGQPVSVSLAIPLPFVADLDGATVIHPPDVVSGAVFSALGSAIQVESREEYDILGAASALMGTYFGILDSASTWLQNRGLPKEIGNSYVRRMCSGLDRAARSNPEASFADLADAYSTKGGLNEQVHSDFKNYGGTEALDSALGRVLTRIRRSTEALS